MNKKVRAFYLEKRKLAVRGAVNRATGGIWGGGVRVAKNLNPNAIPDNLTLNGVSVKPGCTADSFAAHFHKRIRLNSSKVKIDMNGVYNGKCKLIVQNRNFMTAADVKCCLDELTNVKCEGFDRIPVCVICDAREKLLPLWLPFLIKSICHVKFQNSGK